MDATVTVDYAAEGAACLSEPDFWSAFASRAKVTRSERGALVIVVRIQPARGKLVGSLRVTRGSEILLARELEDTSCADVGTALAIAAALVVESTPPPPPPPPSVLPPPAMIAPPPPISPWSFEASAGIALTSVLGPRGSLGLHPAIAIEHAGHGFLGPRLRVGAHLASSFPFDVEQATVTVTSVLARLELDALRFRFARVMTVRAGALVEAGAMIARTRTPAGEREDSRPFASAGAMVRLAWRPSALFVELGAGALVPITRPTLRLVREGSDGSVTAFEVPVVGGTLEIALGVRL